MALCLLSGSQLVGCGSQGTSRSQSDIGAPPILLRDPSPSQLEAFINATMGGYERTTREMTTIGLSFSSNGRLVQFAGHEHLTCNGSAVLLQNRVASFQVAEAPSSTLEGHPFSCTYSAGGTSATLMLTISRMRQLFARLRPSLRCHAAQTPSLPMRCEVGSSWELSPWVPRRTLQWHLFTDRGSRSPGMDQLI